MIKSAVERRRPSHPDPGWLALGYDLVAISVIFSWHAPIAREIALRVKDNAEVWCGGPGMFTLGNWWKRETGLDVMHGLDHRFEHQRGDYLMTFASRGCPVGCNFCVVPKLEGTSFTLDWDFQPAPILCDNNLSALPVKFQEHIIRRYQETGVPLRDANSGFEPKSFDESTYRRWKKVLRGPWRFALDEQREVGDVRRMMAILAGEPRRRKRVYVLVGNESVESCYERVLSVLAWGGEPYAQYVLPLNWLGDEATLHHRYDWNSQWREDFARYVNRFTWRYAPVGEYQPRTEGSRAERQPFAGSLLDTPEWEARWQAAMKSHQAFSHVSEGEKR